MYLMGNFDLLFVFKLKVNYLPNNLNIIFLETLFYTSKIIISEWPKLLIQMLWYSNPNY